MRVRHALGSVVLRCWTASSSLGLCLRRGSSNPSGSARLCALGGRRLPGRAQPAGSRGGVGEVAHSEKYGAVVGGRRGGMLSAEVRNHVARPSTVRQACAEVNSDDGLEISTAREENGPVYVEGREVFPSG